MFRTTKAFSGFSVDDIGNAHHFYGQVLGLDVSTANEMGILELQLAGGARIIVYPKPNHSPATFTILNFPVPDIKAAVSALQEQGVVFESYDDDQIRTDADHIFRGGGPLIAWFRDPAGNILSVIQTDDEESRG